MQRPRIDRHVDLEPGVLHRVEGKMLGAGHHVTLHPARQRCAQRAEMVGIFAVGFLRAAPCRVTQQVDAYAPEIISSQGRTSRPMASPTRSSSVGSQAAPRAMETGKVVPPSRMTPRGPSVKRMPGMPRRVTSPADQNRLL